MAKAVRRDWLRRRVAAGKMEARCDLYIEHDGDGSSDSFGGQWMPARIQEPKFARDGNGVDRCVDDDFIAGQMNLRASYFQSNCGRAYRSADSDVITLHVHSNLCYSLRPTKGNQHG